MRFQSDLRYGVTLQYFCTGELGYDGPLNDRLLSMTDHMLGPSDPVPCISRSHMYMMDFAYDGPNFLVPLSLSYPRSPIHVYT